MDSASQLGNAIIDGAGNLGNTIATGAGMHEFKQKYPFTFWIIVVILMIGVVLLIIYCGTLIVDAVNKNKDKIPDHPVEVLAENNQALQGANASVSAIKGSIETAGMLASGAGLAAKAVTAVAGTVAGFTNKIAETFIPGYGDYSSGEMYTRNGYYEPQRKYYDDTLNTRQYHTEVKVVEDEKVEFTLVSAGNTKTLKLPKNLPTKTVNGKFITKSYTSGANDSWQEILSIIRLSIELQKNIDIPNMTTTPDMIKKQDEYYSELDANWMFIYKKLQANLSEDKYNLLKKDLDNYRSESNRFLGRSESFANDLPNMNVTYTEDMDYNDYMANMALESSIKTNHNTFVNDKTKTTSTPSFLPSRSDSQTVVPWVGLRRPIYTTPDGKDVVDNTARNVPSTIDANQLDSPVTIRWNTIAPTIAKTTVPSPLLPAIITGNTTLPVASTKPLNSSTGTL